MTSVASEAVQTRPDGWWKSAVVYQIYPRSFADSNGDGTGDIPGITSKLDYLGELGVDVVWLSPVYASPMDDNGYDISDYTTSTHLGTLAICGERSRGCRAGDQAGDGPGREPHLRRAPVVQSPRSASPKRNWYWWRPAGRGSSPAARAPSRPTGRRPPALPGSTTSAAEHLPVQPEAADLNWENPEVRRAVADMMNWWVDRGVDGFRMDVINLISKAWHGERLDGRWLSMAFAANGGQRRVSGRDERRKWAWRRATC